MKPVIMKIRSIVFRHATLIFIAVLAIFIYTRMPLFFTSDSLINLGSQCAVFGMISVTMTFMMITRVADISVGAQVYLAGIVGIRVFMATDNMLLVIASGIGVCLIASTINGLCIAKAGLPDMITCMAMLFICRGIGNLIVSQKAMVSISDPKFTALGQGRWLGLPYGVWFFLIIFVIGYFLLHKSRFGRYVYAVGNNLDALSATGVNVFLVRMSTFWLTGLICGFAGVANVCRLGGSTYGLAEGLEFTCIASCVVGGVSMLGGSGKMPGTLMGVAVIASINQLLRLFNVSSYLYNFVWGLVVLVTVSMDLLKNKQIIYEKLHRKSYALEKNTDSKGEIL